MPRRKTNEEFVNELKQTNPNITPLENYVNAITSIKFRCDICGHEFKNSPNKIIACKQGCRKCYNQKITTSEDEFLEKAKLNSNVTVLGTYKNSREKIEVKCNHCGKIFYTRAEHVVAGRGCINCVNSGKNKGIKISQEYFKEVLYKNNPYVKPLEDYKGQKVKIKFRCIICNHEWYATGGHVMRGESGCPKCNMPKGEKLIFKFLSDNNIEFKTQYSFIDCRDKSTLPFDFYLPKRNTCIEFDGEQHDRDVEFFKYDLDYIQRHDKIKTDYCNKNGINLIRIPYKDLKNIDSILFKELIA